MKFLYWVYPLFTMWYGYLIRISLFIHLVRFLEMHSVSGSGVEECPSHDDGHQGDEEDSAATSISDAMIDDEIADQPGLVMLGQVHLIS